MLSYYIYLLISRVTTCVDKTKSQNFFATLLEADSRLLWIVQAETFVFSKDYSIFGLDGHGVCRAAVDALQKKTAL